MLNIKCNNTEAIKPIKMRFTLGDLVNCTAIVGTNYNDRLIGNTNNNTIYGQDGDDDLNGDIGINILNGGKGNDVFVIPTAVSKTIIEDLELSNGKEKVDLSNFSNIKSFEDLKPLMQQKNYDTQIVIDNDHKVLIKDIDYTRLHESNFVFVQHDKITEKWWFKFIHQSTGAIIGEILGGILTGGGIIGLFVRLVQKCCKKDDSNKQYRDLEDPKGDDQTDNKPDGKDSQVISTLSKLANEFTPDYTTQEKTRRNIKNFPAAQKIVNFIKNDEILSKEFIEGNAVEKEESRQDVLRYLHINIALTVYYMRQHNKNNCVLNSLELLTDAKKTIQNFVRKYQNDESLELEKLSHEMLYSLLSDIKGFVEVYAKIAYFYGRIYVYLPQDSQERKDFFEEAERSLKLAQYLGKEAQLFESYQSQLVGLGILYRERAEELIKEDGHQEAKKILEEILDLYNYLLQDATEYKLNYNYIGEFERTIPSNNVRCIADCWEQKARCYIDLMNLKDSNDWLNKMIEDLVSIRLGAEYMTPTKSASLLNILSKTLKKLHDNKIKITINIQDKIIQWLNSELGINLPSFAGSDILHFLADIHGIAYAQSPKSEMAKIAAQNLVDIYRLKSQTDSTFEPDLKKWQEKLDEVTKILAPPTISTQDDKVKTTFCCCKAIVKYDNALLNHNKCSELLRKAFQIGGRELSDLVIELGKQENTAKEILQAVKSQTVEEVLYRLLGKEVIKKEAIIFTQQQEKKLLTYYVDKESEEILSTELQESKNMLRLDNTKIINNNLDELFRLLKGIGINQSDIIKNVTELIQYLVDTNAEQQKNTDIMLLDFLFNLLDTVGSSNFVLPLLSNQDPDFDPDDFDNNNNLQVNYPNKPNVELVGGNFTDLYNYNEASN